MSMSAAVRMSFAGQQAEPAEEHDDLPLPAEHRQKQCKTAELRQAVKAGNLARTESCLSKLSDELPAGDVRELLAELDDEGLTVLHQAIFVSQGLALLKLLVRYGGDIGVRDEEGCTLLHTAAMVSSKPITGWLINEGANLVAFDGEGHLPMDRCDEPQLQDVFFQAMARVGLIGIAMPPQQHFSWHSRTEDFHDRSAGDSDYGTSSSVGSCSEDEDRLSLHSTQSFSSTEEGTVDRESPLPAVSVVCDASANANRRVSVERAGSPVTSIPACPQLVRVRAKELYQVFCVATVHQVDFETPSLQARTSVAVLRRVEPSPRRAEPIFITAESPGSSRQGPSTEGERELDASLDRSLTGPETRGPTGEPTSDNEPVGPPSSLSERHEKSVSSDSFQWRNSASDCSAITCDSVIASRDCARDCFQQQRNITTSSSGGNQELVVLQVVERDNSQDDESLQGLGSGGSSSDETIRNTESDAESIAADLSSTSTSVCIGDAYHRVVSSWLRESRISVSHSLLQGDRAQAAVADELTSGLVYNDLVQETSHSRRQLVASVESLDKLGLPFTAAEQPKIVGGPAATTNTAVDSLDSGDDSAVAGDVREPADTDQSSFGEAAPAPATVISSEGDNSSCGRADDMELAAMSHGRHQPPPSGPLCSAVSPSTLGPAKGKYLSSARGDKKSSVASCRQAMSKKSSDYNQPARAISRRNTVSEVDMGWVAPLSTTITISPGSPHRSTISSRPKDPVKPLKSLLRTKSVSDYDRAQPTVAPLTNTGEDQQSKPNSSSASRRKKSVSFPAEVMLNDAIHMGDLEELRGLLASGAISVDTMMDNGLTPLHSAVLERQREIVKLLLASGASVQQMDSDGWTALHAAATEGTVPVTHLLLENGADPWVKTLKERKTAYELASNDNVRLVLSKAMGDAYRTISLIPTSTPSDSEASEDDEEEEEDEGSEIEQSDDELESQDIRVRDSDVEDNNSNSEEEGEESDGDDEATGSAAAAAVGGSLADSNMSLTSSGAFAGLGVSPVSGLRKKFSSFATSRDGSSDEDSEHDGSRKLSSLLRADSLRKKRSAVAPTPLANAIVAGDVEAVEQLIENASRDDLKAKVGDSGDGLLHVAARTGYTSIIEKLLDFGIKASATNAYGQRPHDLASNDEARRILQQALARSSRKSLSTAI